jgi:4-amino-4-deoxy-L-arabinose transferase-like glycosyltransferase
MERVWTLVWTVAFFFAAAGLLLRWMSACGLKLPGGAGRPAYAGERGERVGARETAGVFCAALLARVGVALAAFCLISAGMGELRPLSQLPMDWVQWDARHYVNLVELGYSGYLENGQHLFLVFFPLYVWLVRPLALLLGNTELAGMLVSFLCYAGGCSYFYRLGAEEYGRPTARRAVLYLSIFPFSFFFGGIMTESLFFLTMAAGFYAVKRHRWLEAGVWGALAALTRMHGVLLIIAAGAELMEQARPFEKRGAELGRAVKAVARKLPALLLPLLGTACYLLLNLRVDGDPFSFVTQQDHWSQGFLWFPKTLWYVLQNTWNYPVPAIRLEIWIPEALLFFLFAGVLLLSWRREPSRYTLYAFAYLILNYSLSWLLSAGRYLSCGLPFFLFAARLTQGRPRVHRAVTLLMGLGFLFFLSRYLSGGQVM